MAKKVYNKRISRQQRKLDRRRLKEVSKLEIKGKIEKSMKK